MRYRLRRPAAFRLEDSRGCGEVDVPVSRVRILVADDYKPWRVHARKLLQEQLDCRISEACDGIEAVQKATLLHPDIVLLDISMPTMNGIEAAERIQQATPGSRVIFLTQNTDSEIMSATLNAGAKGYVLKANAATELLPVIAAALPDRSPV